jgi:hypothetical protein
VGRRPAQGLVRGGELDATGFEQVLYVGHGSSFR